MSSTPSSAVDENNNIYMAYSMVMEGAAYRQNNKSQQYRHIMIIHSEDGGETWSEPFDAVNAACTGDTDLSIYKEAVFPSMVRDIDDEIMFLYQQDFRPGLSTGGGGDPPETNFIRFVRIDVSELGIVKAKEVIKSKILQVTVYPNPTDGKVTVSFELERSTQVNHSLYNFIGQQIRSNHLDNLPKGKHQFQFDMENLPSGVYLLELNTGYKMAVTRIVVN